MRIRLEKTPSFWAYIVGGFICIAVGILLLPAWAGAEVFFSSWSAYSVNIMISALLLAYILLYLMKRIKRYSNTPAQVVAIVELVLMAVLAVVCAISEFVEYGINFGGPCQIFGIALWIRGASGVYTGYYCDSNLVKEAEQQKKAQKKSDAAPKGNDAEAVAALDTDRTPRGRVDDFTVWRLTLAIVLITAGAYLVLEPAFEKIHLQWVFSCAIILISCFFVVLGFALKPSKIRVEAHSPKAEVPKEENTAVNSEDAEQSDAAGYLESGKVKINFGSANAMTKTAAYDAIKDEIVEAQAVAKAEEKPKTRTRRKKTEEKTEEK